jgi:hypothetical protein
MISLWAMNASSDHGDWWLARRKAVAPTPEAIRFNQSFLFNHPTHGLLVNLFLA